MIASAAAQTRRIRLGTGVVSILYHHPFMVAQRMSFLDYLTESRAIFGVGSGGLASDLSRSLAVELGRNWIRVNAVLPGVIDTPLLHEQRAVRATAAGVTADVGTAEPDEYTGPNLLPIPLIDPREVSNAVLFFASDEARYITGAELAVDAGALQAPAIQTGR